MGGNGVNRCAKDTLITVPFEGESDGKFNSFLILLLSSVVIDCDKRAVSRPHDLVEDLVQFVNKYIFFNFVNH